MGLVLLATTAQSAPNEWTCGGSGDYFAITEVLRDQAPASSDPEQVARQSISFSLSSDERTRATDGSLSDVPLELIRREDGVFVYAADISEISARSNLEIRVASGETGGYQLEGLRVCLE
jgi:hypothetical protein